MRGVRLVHLRVFIGEQSVAAEAVARVQPPRDCFAVHKNLDFVPEMGALGTDHRRTLHWGWGSSCALPCALRSQCPFKME